MRFSLRWLWLCAPLLASAGVEATANGSAHSGPEMTMMPAASLVHALDDATPFEPRRARPQPAVPQPVVTGLEVGEPSNIAAATVSPVAEPSPYPEIAGATDEGPAEEDAAAELPSGEVYWTVLHTESVDSIAGRWGLKRKQLLALNPGLPRRKHVQAGTRLRVYAPSGEYPTLSIGSPNKGRLQHGMPLPEGPYWSLRERRPRTFGAINTIHALVGAFSEYGRQFDEAPPVPVGEISARRGGRAPPHRSHRTGRDVDLGYILTETQEGARWVRASEDNFDVAKNWTLIEALVRTGEVQQIFISNRLQRLLRPYARARLTDEQMGRYFRMPGQDPKHVPILKHWDGHRDHMHVRFHCEDENGRCRSRSSKKKSKTGRAA